MLKFLFKDPKFKRKLSKAYKGRQIRIRVYLCELSDLDILLLKDLNLNSVTAIFDSTQYLYCY